MGNVLSGHRKTQMALFAFLIVMNIIRAENEREEETKRSPLRSIPKKEKAKLGKLGQSYMWKVFYQINIFHGSFKIFILLVLNKTEYGKLLSHELGEFKIC